MGSTFSKDTINSQDTIKTIKTTLVQKRKALRTTTDGPEQIKLKADIKTQSDLLIKTIKTTITSNQEKIKECSTYMDELVKLNAKTDALMNNLDDIIDKVNTKTGSKSLSKSKSKSMKETLRNLEQNGLVNQTGGEGEGADPSMNPRFCDGHITQCRDMMDTCQNGGTDYYKYYKQYKQLYKQLKYQQGGMTDAAMNPNFCDGFNSQCRDYTNNCPT